MIGVVLVLCAVIIFLALQRSTVANSENTATQTNQILATTAKSQVQSSEVSTTSSATEIYVDIKGAVNHPGVYRVDAMERLQDLVTKAGGFIKEADQTQVNLASKLQDQQLVYIPKIGEELSEVQVPTTDTTTSGEEEADESTEKINLNTADEAQLQELTGIGEKKAQEIIAYRQEHGSFQSTDELKEVSGIGDKTFETLESLITVE